MIGKSIAAPTQFAFTQLSSHDGYPLFGVHISLIPGNTLDAANFLLEFDAAVRLQICLSRSIELALNSPDIPETDKERIREVRHNEERLNAMFDKGQQK